MLSQKGFTCTEKSLREGLRSAAQVLLGRWQLLSTEPYVLCDIAHNEAALRAVFAQIARQFTGHVYAIIGFSREKVLSGLFDALPLSVTYFATEAPLPRALSSKLLYDTMKERHFKVTHAPSLAQAYQDARTIAKPHDLILICGSAYLLAYYLKFFKKK